MTSIAISRAQSVAFFGLMCLALSLAWSTAGFSIGIILAMLGGLACLRASSLSKTKLILLPTLFWVAVLIIGGLRSPATQAWDEVRGFYPLLLIFPAAAALTSYKRLVWVAGAFVIATAAAGFMALLADLGLIHPENLRFSGFVTILTYSATMANAFLLAAVFFCWCPNRRWSILWLLCGMLHLEGIVMNATRAAMVAIVMGLVVVAVLGRGKRLRLLLFLSPFLVATPFVLQGELGERFWETRSELLADGEGISQRRIMWTAARRMFEEHPMMGVGPGNFRPELDAMYADGRMDGFPKVEERHQQAHSAFMHVAATTGLVGLLAMLWWFGALFWCLWRKGNRFRVENLVGLAALALFLGFSLSDTSLRNSRVTAMMAACVGAGLASVSAANAVSAARKQSDGELADTASKASGSAAANEAESASSA
ncbi:MAG: O-antigen ligase family protein [Planctomycetes bacterium]|nr:O-antigen ligase family protein [Planctomycetota bacterium]